MDFIKLFPPELQKNMTVLWEGCPPEIRESVRVVEVPKGQDFICAGEPCNHVYILLRGTAWGIDLQVLGKQYKFKRFEPGRFLGEFECFSGARCYTLTIQAETNCLFAVIGVNAFLEWMKSDVNALFLRASETIQILTQQTQNDRRFFLSPCIERMMQYLVKCYEEQDGDVLVVEHTRDELASALGFVVRTIERNIKKLERDGMITLQKGKIQVTSAQYTQLKAHIAETVPNY